MSRIIKSDTDRASMRASATYMHPLHDDFDPLADDPDAPPDPEFASIRKGKDRPNSRRAIRLTNDVNALLISELESDGTKRQSFQAPPSAVATPTFGAGYSTPTQANLSASLPGPQSSAGTLGRRATSSKVLAMARSIDGSSSPGSTGSASPAQEVREKEPTPEPARDPARELARRDSNYTSPTTGGSMRANGGIGRNRGTTISTVTYQVESPSSTGDSLARLFASPPSLSSSIPTPASPPTTTTSPPASDLNSSGEGLGGSARRFFTLKRGGGGVQPPPQSDLNTEYDNYLAIAKREEFNDVAPLNFMYPSGKDAMGRTIIVMIGAHLPAKKIDLERVMLYAISVMDPVVESEYVLVYAHTNMSAENRPNFAWLRKMYTIFNRKYKKNLKQLYIIHPTVWVKMTFRLFKPFVSNKFWKKLLYVDQTADLWKYFSKEQLKLPDYIVNYGAPPRKVQPMFGAPLDEVVARPENNLHNDSGQPREIPKLVDDAVRYLRERAMTVEGLFRLSGSSAQIKELKKSLDAGEDVDLNEVEDPHVVAGILKLYLRELPSPLLVNCHTSMLNVYLLPTKQQQIDCLKMIIGSLPRVHRATALYLIPFWHEVTLMSAENKMTPANLSIVTAPNICKNPQETMESAVQDTPGINSAVCLLIQHAHEIIY